MPSIFRCDRIRAHNAERRRAQLPNRPHRCVARSPDDPSDQIDILAEELRLATRALGRLTGRIDVEEILDVIFRDFCIGK